MNISDQVRPATGLRYILTSSTVRVIVNHEN